MKIACKQQPHPTRRTSPDSAWPLRAPCGLTFAERRAMRALPERDETPKVARLAKPIARGDARSAAGARKGQP